MDRNWQNAVGSVNKLLVQNGEFLNTIYQIGKMNEAESNQKVFEQALKEVSLGVDAEGYDENAIDLKFLRSTAKDIHKHFNASDLSQFVEEREELVVDFGIYRSQIHTLSRTFGDMVRRGPRNEAEEILIVAATAFLEPHEFKKAVTSSMAPKEVADMIEASKVKQFTDIILQNAGANRVHQAQEEIDEPMPNILGEEMGVMDSIQHGFETTSIVQNASLDEVKAPITPPVEHEKGKGRDKGG
jgi:hypothetical protein